MAKRSAKYGDNKGSGGVSLWDLLTFQPLGVALGVALGSARRGGLDFWLYPVMGIIIGAICIWFIRALGCFILGRFIFKFRGERLSNNTGYEDIIVKLLYLFTCLWIVISGILSYWGVKFMVVFLK